MNKKEHERLEGGGLTDEVSPVAGIPDDILDKLEQIEGDYEEAERAARRGHKRAAYIVQRARGTRAELQTLLLNGVVPKLLRLALNKKNTAAKHWAGMMLASIGCSVWKHDKKLCEVNVAYREEKKKIISEKQLLRVLFPGPIMKIVQRELVNAKECQRTLRRLKKMYDDREFRKSAERQEIEDYLGLVNLPDFSERSEPDWWKELWRLIKKNNPDLLEQLRSGKFPTRGIRYQSRWSSYRTEFRNCLGTLARLRNGGVL